MARDASALIASGGLATAGNPSPRGAWAIDGAGGSLEALRLSLLLDFRLLGRTGALAWDWVVEPPKEDFDGRVTDEGSGEESLHM